MSWKPKAGDWVTGRSSLLDVGNLSVGRWDPGDQFEVQPGRTYQVGGVGTHTRLVSIPGHNDTWIEWLRPATREEQARAELASLEGL